MLQLCGILQTLFQTKGILSRAVSPLWALYEEPSSHRLRAAVGACLWLWHGFTFRAMPFLLHFVFNNVAPLRALIQRGRQVASYVPFKHLQAGFMLCRSFGRKRRVGRP